MTALSSLDIRDALDRSPMNGARVVIILLTLLLSALDGYDVLSMSLAAPPLSRAWHLDKSTLGWVLSSGLFGMAGGSLGLAPIADALGRRPLILMSVALMGFGSLGSALARSLTELTESRVLTGLGVGAIVALLTSLAAEFANAKHRSFAVATMAIGYPLGGVVGGFGAALLLRREGWHAIFAVGAIAAAVLFVAMVMALPESPFFIVAHPSAKRLARLNAVLPRLGQPRVSALRDEPRTARASYRALFSSGLGAATARLTAVNLLAATAAYYLLSWLPQLVSDAGFRPSTASLVSATASLVGVGAGLMLGRLASKIAPGLLAGFGMIGLGVGISIFGTLPRSLPAIFVTAGACGFCLFGSTAAFYAAMAAAFTPLTRASGTGFVMGVGRFSSAVGPVLAGWLFTVGLNRAAVSVVFAVFAVLAGLILVMPSSSSKAWRPLEAGARQ